MNKNTIICGDNVKILSEFPDECIDLTVTSPPYDNLRVYNGYSFDFEELAKQLFRITKIGGVVVWVVADKKNNGSESGTSMRQALYFMEIGFNLHDTMIFRKLNGAMGSINEYLQEFEFMYVFSKGKIKTSNLIRDRKNVVHGDKTTPKKKSTELGSSKNRHVINRKIFGRRKNIWDYAVGGKQEIGNHPAPFPKQLAQDHIISWSNKGDLILDPFCGSGTTLKMAKILGRDYIGIDISQEYCDLSQKRVDSV